MGLKDLQFPKATIKVPGGEADQEVSFTVRGLSLQDATIIFASYKPIIIELFNRFEKEGDAALEQMIEEVIVESPGLIATIIACAADEMTDQDAIANALRLPLPVQMEALYKIGEMTFAVEGSLKKMVEMAMRAIQAASQEMASLKA